MLIAVTGATGFVGRHFIARARASGHGVRALVRPGRALPADWLSQDVSVVTGTVEDDEVIAPQLLRDAEALVFLAAVGVQRRDRTWEQTGVNVSVPLRWLQQAKRAGVRCVIVPGTCLEYSGHGRLPNAIWHGSPSVVCGEESAVETADIYGATKAAGGLLLRAFARSAELDLWYLRFASLYGLGDDPDKFLPAAMAALRAGVPFKMSGGEQVREWLYIEDAIDAMVIALKTRAPGGACVLNVGTGQGMALNALARLVCELVHADPGLLQPGALPYRPHEAHRLVMDVRAQRRLSGFVPRWTVEAGLAALVQKIAAPRGQ